MIAHYSRQGAAQRVSGKPADPESYDLEASAERTKWRGLEPSRSSWKNIRSTTPKDHPAFDAMREVCRAEEMPRSFGTDVQIHDRELLKKAGPKDRFGWVLYERGAQLTWTAQGLRILHKSIGEDYPRFVLCVWDGSTFRRFADLEEACDAMRGGAS